MEIALQLVEFFDSKGMREKIQTWFNTKKPLRLQQFTDGKLPTEKQAYHPYALEYFLNIKAADGWLLLTIENGAYIFRKSNSTPPVRRVPTPHEK